MIVATDLLSPLGPLDTSLFPGEASNVLEARIIGWLNEAYGDPRVAMQTEEARRDSLAEAWTLHRSFQQVYIRMTTQPVSLTVTEKGGHAYSSEQIRNIRQLSDKYLADFNGLLAVAPDNSVRLPGTVSVRNIVDW